MRAFTTHRGVVAPLDRANVDTDQIIPKQFLKSIRKTGFGDNLFDAWRYLDEGVIGKTPNERLINREFVLNAPEYQGATVLLARDNFGCGSSREHAVWALLEYGFRCVIAPSFADIFFNNCVKNGILLIPLPEDAANLLMDDAGNSQTCRMAVDLEAQAITRSNGETVGFEIEPFRKHRLLNGLDDIGITMTKAGEIDSFEAKQKAAQPWLYGGEHSAG